ncbi:MAG: hypothetical protein KF729_23375 [Sandaracinaceae bacterium]|nr:hypothetical protein [Sandaracinaceae bacterium]
MGRFALVIALAVSGCSDPSSCPTPGVARCDGAGGAVERCVATERGPRWQTEPCAARNPRCVERAGTASCVAERLGDCDEATFEDSCPDEHTLEDCAAGARHRVRCAEGERCERSDLTRAKNRQLTTRHACSRRARPSARRRS